MIINSLHIYGFGKWQEKQLQLTEGMNVIYGNNEAGKSTLRAFIQYILFGFTNKQEEEKFRPKFTSSFGGKLHLTIHEKQLIAERKQVDTKEQFNLVDMDGNIVSLVEWKAMLNNIDKATYEAIFSFDQLGLQRIKELKGDELSKYLFSSSVIGSDELYLIEKKLDAQLKELYKKRGNNHKIGQSLEQVTIAFKALKNYENNIATYEEKVASWNETNERLTHIQHKIEELSLLIQEDKQLLELRGELTEIEELSKELDGIDFVSITEEEMLSFLQLESESSRLEQSLNELQVTVEQLESSKDKLSMRKKSDAQLAESLISNDKIYQEKIQEVQQMEQKLLNLQDQMEQIVIQEGIVLPKEVLLSMNTSGFLKEELQSINDEEKQIKTQITPLVSELEIIESTIAQREVQLEILNEELLTEQEVNKLQEIVASEGHSNQLAIRQQVWKEQLEWKEKQLTIENKKRRKKIKTGRILYGSLLILSIIMFVFYLNLSVIPLLISSIILLLISLVGLLYKGRATAISLLKKEIDELSRAYNKGDIVAFDSIQVNKAKNQLIRWEQCIREFQQQKARMEEWQEEYVRLIAKHEKLLLQQHSLEIKLEKIKQEWKLQGKYSSGQLLYLFDCFVRLKDISVEMSKLERLKVNLYDWIQSFQTKLIEESKKWGIEETLEYTTILSELRIKRDEYITNQSQLMEVVSSLEKNQELVAQKQVSKGVLDNQLAEWLQLKGIHQKNNFYTNYDLSKEYREKKNRLSQLQLVIKATNISEERIIQYRKIPFDNHAIQLLEKELANLKAEQVEKLEKKIQLKNEMDSIEDGKPFEGITTSFEQKKALYEQSIEEWLEIAIAKEKLQRTIRFYTEEKLPRILLTASNYFSSLTMGIYSQIMFNKESRFIVKNDKDDFFEIGQLSQGTMEQVYISLRLALANNVFKDSSYPLIIDDGFVHFDSERLSNMILQLEQMKERQLLLFTCHEHISDKVRANTKIVL